MRCNTLTAVPMTRDRALEYLRTHHRHHKYLTGYKFAVGAMSGDELVGIVVVGRPTARMTQSKEPLTCEVTRLCTNGYRNACSFLYAIARKVAFLMGYRRIITYILDSEPGTSLKAAGWQFVRAAGGGAWTRPSRLRESKAPEVPKQLWEAVSVG